MTEVYEILQHRDVSLKSVVTHHRKHETLILVSSRNMLTVTVVIENFSCYVFNMLIAYVRLV